MLALSIVLEQVYAQSIWAAVGSRTEIATNLQPKSKTDFSFIYTLKINIPKFDIGF